MYSPCLLYVLEISRLICLESDNESENGIGRGNLKENENETTCVDSNVLKVSDLSSQFVEPACSPGKFIRFNLVPWCLDS